jgi:hypothetical protein
MRFKIYDDSRNYTAQIVRLRNVQQLDGLDNLVGASIQGNLALITKDYPLDELYIYFPSGCVLSKDFISKNNLFREETFNIDISKKGFFEPNCRTKAVKFRGHKSTAFLCPISFLASLGVNISKLSEGDEFNEIDKIFICKKFVLQRTSDSSRSKVKGKLLDKLVDALHFKEHIDTNHLLKYIDKFDLDKFVITIKLHGTSARVANTIVKRRLFLIDKIAKFLGAKIQDEEFGYLCGSHHVVKSLNFNELDGKNHFYNQDLWTRAGEEYFKGKLNKGECIYYELVGLTYEGKEIQKGYSYGFTKPTPFIYRISHVNEDGVEIDLSFSQVMARANELGVQYVPFVFSGSLKDYAKKYNLNEDLNNIEFGEDLQKRFLEQKSVFDKKIVEEGIVLSIERYPRPHLFKLKSPSFIIHESHCQDKAIPDIEEES